MRRSRRSSLESADFNINSMIDIVFLLLIFFLVTAKPHQPEADLSLQLPGTVAQEEALDIPDEQRIEIHSNGQVLLNELPVDTPHQRSLPQLTSTLIRFKQATQANQSEALITLAPHDKVPHQRIVDVMNACALAEIDGVTFATDEQEELF